MNWYNFWAPKRHWWEAKKRNYKRWKEAIEYARERPYKSKIVHEYTSEQIEAAEKWNTLRNR